MMAGATVEDLCNCCDDRERAEWLLSAPYAVLLCEVMGIRRALMAAGFQAGLRYLEAEIQFLNRPRNPNASFEPMMIRAARGDLRCIAFGAAS